MSSPIPHKTLVKLLSYVACRRPDEYGLFWDPAGTMPWKEFHWALQQDPDLRFVREATIKELELLGFELPFTLRDGLLKLVSPGDRPCPVPCHPPSFLHYHVRRKQFRAVRRHGLNPQGGRTYLPLCSAPELSRRIAARRDRRAIAVQVLAGEAYRRRIEFLRAGEDLYLVTGVPVEFLVLPAISEEKLEALAPRRNRKASAAPAPSLPSPVGSFYVDSAHLEGGGSARRDSHGKAAAGRKAKGKGKDDWKRRARKERRKRQA